MTGGVTGGTGTGSPPGVGVRPLTEDDMDEVVGLLGRALGPAPGGADRRALFAWKHLGNPFGRSIALVAEAEGRIAGLRSFMRWRLLAPGGEVAAVRAVDTATDPAVQRRGVFTELTRAALGVCEDEGMAFVFNTPNRRSLPGYLKMGWTVVTRWPVWVKARRPHRLLWAAARRDLAAGAAFEPPGGSPLVPAGAALDRPGVAALAETAGPRDQLATERTHLYLRWRYAAGPLPYHALSVGDPPAALAILRLRRRGALREAVVCEVLSAPDATRAVAEVMAAVPRAAGADHAVAHFGPGWPARAEMARAGYRRVPRAGMTFTVRPVRPPSGVPGLSPLDPAAWSLSLGDLEVF